MLQLLRIRNLALLKAVDLEFSQGFITVTGETGAGKSILLGALSLLAGNRAERSLIRSGADHCEVEGVLHLQDTTKVDAILSRAGVPTCEDGCLVLSRSIYRNKAGRVFINGSLTTVAVLRELGECWVDFHGPGEPQKLFHESYQLELFDLSAAHEHLLQAYTADYQRWEAAVAEKNAVLNADRLSKEEAEFLARQIERIETICPDRESIQKLETDYQRVFRMQELLEGVQQIENGLVGEESAVERLGTVVRLARSLAEIDGEIADWAQRLETVAIELQDVAADAGHFLSSLEGDEAQIADIESRMQQWLELRRSYGPSVEMVLQRKQEYAERLRRSGDVEGELERLDREIESVEQSLAKSALSLRRSREKQVPQLSAKVTRLLALLGFQKADFQVELIQDRRWHARGDSHCRFLFAPNPGEPAMPLNQIASSGETARVMLALKAVLAEMDHTPVLVFDEVDANVGGEIGAVVGAELHRLAKGHQVFCVTHLPQVAAQGDGHLLVQKKQDEHSTTVEFIDLMQDREQRIGEIARMLGARDSRSAVNHARELLGC